jgi:hypothetical protein
VPVLHLQSSPATSWRPAFLTYCERQAREASLTSSAYARAAIYTRAVSGTSSSLPNPARLAARRGDNGLSRGDPPRAVSPGVTWILTTLQLPLYRKLLPGKTRGEKKRGKGIIAGTRKREKGKAKRPEPEPERVKGERGKPSKKKKEKGVHPQKLKNHIDQTERAAFESFASCDLTDRPRADRHTDRPLNSLSLSLTHSHLSHSTLQTHQPPLPRAKSQPAPAHEIGSPSRLSLPLSVCLARV